LSVDVNSVLGLVHRVVVGDDASISDVYVISIFTVEVCELVSCCVYIAFVLKLTRGRGGRGDIDALPMPLGKLCRWPF
jgi:hypothetical protein